MTPTEEAEYQRRLALREKRRAEVREAIGFVDSDADDPDRRVPLDGSGVFWLGGWSTGR